MLLVCLADRSGKFSGMTGSVRTLLQLAVALSISSSCSRPGDTVIPVDAGIERVVVAGSTALLPLVTEAANRFMHQHKNIAVLVEAGGSRAGLDRLIKGSATIAASDIFAPDNTVPALEDHPIAVAGFAAMANRGKYNAHVESLTFEQLKGIFSGKVKDWAEVGGLRQSIVLVNRGKNSGTRAAFGRIVLGGDEFGPGLEMDSSALVLTTLEQTRGAISYVALSYARDTLKVFAVGGILATNENVANGTYPIWSYEHLYTRGPATGAAKAFIDFIQTPQVQTELVPKNGLTSINVKRE